MQTIWERRVDRAKLRRNLLLFWLFYGLPAGLVVLCGGVLEGLGGAAGLTILLGLLGSMIFFAIWLTGRTKKTNTVIRLDRGELVWATRRVPVDQVVRFTTLMKNASMSMTGITGSHTNATAELGVARFELADGEEVEFVFPFLEQGQLEALHGALEGVLPGRGDAPRPPRPT